MMKARKERKGREKIAGGRKRKARKRREEETEGKRKKKRDSEAPQGPEGSWSMGTKSSGANLKKGRERSSIINKTDLKPKHNLSTVLISN